MGDKIIIDATGLVLGRLASHVAKKALEGETVIIINAEKAVLTGNKIVIQKKYKQRRDRRSFSKGPYFPRMPERIVRRTIRGMVNYKSDRGKKAYKRVKVFIGTPRELVGKNAKTIKSADIKKLKVPRYTEIGELSKWLGAKW